MRRHSLRSGPVWLTSLALAVIGSAALRCAVADHSLWFDEQASVFFAGRPLRQLWSDWMLRETNPALYYSLLKGWMLAFGSSDRAIRLLSVAASLVAIVLISTAARRLYGDRAGAIAAAMAALSGYQLYFAEQARAYIFVLCAAVVALDAVLAILRRDDGGTAGWRPVATYIVAATAGIYLHTTMALLPILVLGAAVLASPRRWWYRPGPILTLVAADLAIMAASGWAIRAGILQLLHGSGNIEPIGRVGVRDGVAYVLQTVSLGAFPSRIRYVMAALIALVIAWFAVVDRLRFETRFLVAVVVVSFVLLGGLGTMVPVFVPRTLFWLSGPLIVLAAAAAARLATWWRLAVLALLMPALAVDTMRLAPRLQSEDWNGTVRQLSSHPGALLLVEGEALALLQDETCRRKLMRRTCPYPVIEVTNARDHFDSWAKGLFQGREVAVGDLPALVARRPVYIFRKPPYHDLLDLLPSRQRWRDRHSGSAQLIGPVDPSLLTWRADGSPTA